MKTYQEVEKIAKQFSIEYKGKIPNWEGTIGISKDADTNEWFLYIYFLNKKKSNYQLPDTYQGVKLFPKKIGKVVAR